MIDYGFYNMDCMEGMKQFPDKFFDLAIVDPPYGINMGHTCGIGQGGGERPFSGNYTRVWGERKSISKAKFYHPFDDSSTPDGKYFEELFRVSKEQVVWGGNFFLDYLDRATCMIVWDKGRRGMDQADCEIAWTSLKGQSRVFNWKWNGMLQEDMKNKEPRIHPTQKPIELYKWLLNTFASQDAVILDTHAGSASSLIACHRTGHKYVGFEIDEYYYKQAKKRLDAEEAQMNIFEYMKQK